MEKWKYEKLVNISENHWDAPTVCDVLGRMVYCMFGTNELNKEPDSKFCVDIVPTEYRGYIGVRIRWGNGEI